MKRFALVLLALAVLVPRARAQQSADDQYIIIYSLMQRADSLADNGQPREALNQYVEVQGELERFQKMFPDWHPNIVTYRLGYLAQKISEVTAQLPVAPPGGTPRATNPPPAAAQTTNLPPANAGLAAQLDSLRAQVQQLEANNTMLAAKLREALAVQPSVIDPRELTQAREQIRQLMKTNSLLEVILSQRAGAGADLDALKQAQLALVVQTQRANQLEQENKDLQSRLQAALATPDSAAALREENALLKKQLADAQTAVTNSAAIASLNVELAAAQKLIASLRSDLDVRGLEKEALENRIKQLQSAAPTNQADQAVIRELTLERDNLLGELGDAKKQLGAKKEDLAAQISELTDEVSQLRARLAADEAQVVPYTPEELALFREPAPLPADPNSDNKPLRELPPDSAVLVAEAQSYFKAGQYGEAEADYQKILQHDQNNGLALANLATIEMQQNKLDDAEKHITAALAQSPNDAYNLSILGNVKIQQGKYDDAIDALSRAAKIDSRNPVIESYLGVALANKGLRTQAETALRKAIEIAPDFGPAHNNLAVIYLGDEPPMPALARWHYEQALKDGQPRNPELEKMLADKGAPVDQ